MNVQKVHTILDKVDKLYDASRFMLLEIEDLFFEYYIDCERFAGSYYKYVITNIMDRLKMNLGYSPILDIMKMFSVNLNFDIIALKGISYNNLELRQFDKDEYLTLSKTDFLKMNDMDKLKFRANTIMQTFYNRVFIL